MKKEFSREEFKASVPQIELIQDPQIKEGVYRAWELGLKDSDFDTVFCRFSPIYPGTINLVEHHRNVARKALLLAECIQEDNQFPVRMDYVLAIALIHDLCKIRDNTPIGDTVDKSEDGKQMPHAFFSAYYAINAGLPVEIASGALTHTGHTKKIPTCLEAIIVSYADMCDVDALRLIYGRELNIEALHRDNRCI